MIETLDQLLFGYRDGHELIAGSRSIPPTAMLDVLPHVDATFEQDEEWQLVGAWVDSLERYLLARIWPAPERARPGAVWAHALLLSAAQLNGCRISTLPALLRRPADDSLDGYDDRQPWPSRADLDATPPSLIHALAEAVCAPDGRPRLVLWPEPTRADAALVALLEALPAPWRRTLSFRTRARARAGAASYRLQVASALSGQHDDAACIVIDPRERDVERDPWALV